MGKTSKFVGLDVHKATITLAVSHGGPGMAIEELGTVRHDVPRLVKRLLNLGPAGSLHVAYEAGPTGYGLSRAPKAAGISCVVVAPSKTPRRPGERVKTDRRDAVLLARYLRAGELVAVAAPDEEKHRPAQTVVHHRRRDDRRRGGRPTAALSRPRLREVGVHLSLERADPRTPQGTRGSARAPSRPRRARRARTIRK